MPLDYILLDCILLNCILPDCMLADHILLDFRFYAILFDCVILVIRNLRQLYALILTEEIIYYRKHSVHTALCI